MKRLETKSKEWKVMREDLLERVKVIDGGISTIINGTPDMISLEGGSLGYVYSFHEKELYVHGKATRHSSVSYSVNDLGILQSILEEWQQDKEVDF
ncbi:hypothetical protein V7166_21865 [Bacillus thuringiensis]